MSEAVKCAICESPFFPKTGNFVGTKCQCGARDIAREDDTLEIQEHRVLERARWFGTERLPGVLRCPRNA